MVGNIYHTLQEMGWYESTSKGGGNFHEYGHPKAPKKHETSLGSTWIPAPFSEGRYFPAGPAPPRASCLPGGKGPKPWDSRICPTLVHTGSCHPIILAVGLGNKKAVKWGVVRTE